MTTPWLLASLGLIPPLLVAVAVAGTGEIGRRFVATALASSLAIFVLLALSFAFDQPSSVDLALTLALLTLPGTLVLALFVERWL
jgi:multisubunit Na+/H+ antiporter MnhF subunit